MSQQSYKILAAKRLAIDPNALLMYFELDYSAVVTTPDGVQHIFTFSELNHPAKKTVLSNQVLSKKVAEKGQKGPGSPLESPGLPPPPATKVAVPQLQKPKTVAKGKK